MPSYQNSGGGSDSMSTATELMIRNTVLEARISQLEREKDAAIFLLASSTIIAGSRANTQIANDSILKNECRNCAVLEACEQATKADVEYGINALNAKIDDLGSELEKMRQEALSAATLASENDFKLREQQHDQQQVWLKVSEKHRECVYDLVSQLHEAKGLPPNKIVAAAQANKIELKEITYAESLIEAEERLKTAKIETEKCDAHNKKILASLQATLLELKMSYSKKGGLDKSAEFVASTSEHLVDSHVTEHRGFYVHETDANPLAMELLAPCKANLGINDIPDEYPIVNTTIPASPVANNFDGDLIDFCAISDEEDAGFEDGPEIKEDICMNTTDSGSEQTSSEDQNISERFEVPAEYMDGIPVPFRTHIAGTTFPLPTPTLLRTGLDPSMATYESTHQERLSPEARWSIFARPQAPRRLNNGEYIADSNYGIHNVIYTPGSWDQHPYRAVLFQGLPKDITIGEVLDRVRGGTVVKAHIANTITLNGSMSAIVYFFYGKAAERYARFTKKWLQVFKGRGAQVSLIKGYPFYPNVRSPHQGTCNWSDSFCRSIEIYGQSRRIVIKNIPKELTAQDIEYDITAYSPAGPPKYYNIIIQGEGGNRVVDILCDSVEKANQLMTIIKVARLFSAMSVEYKEDPCSQEIHRLIQTSIKAPDYSNDAESGWISDEDSAIEPLSNEDKVEGSPILGMDGKPTTFPAVPSKSRFESPKRHRFVDTFVVLPSSRGPLEESEESKSFFAKDKGKRDRMVENSQKESNNYDSSAYKVENGGSTSSHWSSFGISHDLGQMKAYATAQVDLALEALLSPNKIETESINAEENLDICQDEGILEASVGSK